MVPFWQVIASLRIIHWYMSSTGTIDGRIDCQQRKNEKPFIESEPCLEEVETIDGQQCKSMDGLTVHVSTLPEN